MDLQTRKISFIQEFLRLTNEDIISSLEKVLSKRKAEAYEQSMKPMSVDQLNKEIDKALEDSKENRVISASELKAKYKK
jgi:DNA-binding NtrC family response regulator